MRTVRMLSVSLLLAGLVAGTAGGQDLEAGRGKKYALLIGVRKYDPKALRTLEYSENDVAELAAVLERSGYRREDITVLTQTVGAQDFQLLPMAKNIRAQLGIPDRPGLPFKRGLALGPLDGDDSILVAFAGHGVQFQAEGESFFCPMDADLADEPSLIKFSDVAKALDGCKAGFKLLLVDACRNNPQILANRAGERPVVDLPSLSRPFLKRPPGGTALLFSCSAGEVAFEDPELKHGIFFNYVIKGLEGEADRDGDGKVDVNELAAFAPKNVALHVGRKYRVEQTVEVVNHTRGSVALTFTGAVDLLRRGKAALAKRDWDRAIADLTQVVRINPQNATAYFERAWGYAMKRDYDRAIADATEAIRIDPTLQKAYSDRAWYYLGKKDFDASIVDYTSAIRLNPDYAESYYQRANVYRLKRHYDQALADCVQAIRIEPRNAYAYGARASIYGEMGDHSRAIADYNEAIRLYPKYAQAYEDRGKIRAATDPEGAKADRAYAHYLDPTIGKD